MTEAELLAEYPGLTHEDGVGGDRIRCRSGPRADHPRPHRKRGVMLKLDENLSRRAADLVRAAGHDVATVAGQGLRGAADETLFEVRKREGRTLITLDRPSGITTD